MWVWSAGQKFYHQFLKQGNWGSEDLYGLTQSHRKLMGKQGSGKPVCFQTVSPLTVWINVSKRGPALTFIPHQYGYSTAQLEHHTSNSSWVQNFIHILTTHLHSFQASCLHAGATSHPDVHTSVDVTLTPHLQPPVVPPAHLSGLHLLNISWMWTHILDKPPCSLPSHCCASQNSFLPPLIWSPKELPKSFFFFIFFLFSPT